MNDEGEYVVAGVRLDGEIAWYRGPRELWVLDYKKWRNAYISLGHDIPPLDATDRGGIHIVNAGDARAFLSFVEKYRVEKDDLARELAIRYQSARNSWDVADLLPIVFINFDRRHVSGFYPSGTPMEKYVPDGWTGGFEDFLGLAPEEALPAEAKFWIKDGSDLLALLNARGGAGN